MTAMQRKFPTSANHPHENMVSKEQLRRERIKGIAIVAILAALMALMIWLASLGAGSGQVQEYWPMMP